ADEKIKHRYGSVKKSSATQTADSCNTGFSSISFQAVSERGNRLRRASASQGDQCHSLTRSTSRSRFKDAHVEKSAYTQAGEKSWQFFGRGDFDSVEKNGFDDFTVEWFESPPGGRDAPSENVVPHTTKNEGAFVSLLEITSPVPAAQHNEPDEQGDARQRTQDSLDNQPRRFPGPARNESHSSLRSWFGCGPLSDLAARYNRRYLDWR